MDRGQEAIIILEEHENNDFCFCFGVWDRRNSASFLLVKYFLIIKKIAD